MRIEFDKIGQGCNVCTAKPKACPGCERNPGLTQLRDFFQKPPKEVKKPPRPGVKDDTPQIPAKNRQELGEWGIHVPPPAPDQQKSAGENGGTAGSQG